MALSPSKLKREALVVASQQQQRLENIISHQFWQTTQEQIDLYRQLIVTRSVCYVIIFTVFIFFPQHACKNDVC